MVYRAGVDGGMVGATVFCTSVSVDAVCNDVVVAYVNSRQVQHSAEVDKSRGYVWRFLLNRPIHVPQREQLRGSHVMLSAIEHKRAGRDEEDASQSIVRVDQNSMSVRLVVTALRVHIIFIWYVVLISDRDGRLEASPHDHLPGLSRFVLMCAVRQQRRGS